MIHTNGTFKICCQLIIKNKTNKIKHHSYVQEVFKASHLISIHETCQLCVRNLTQNQNIALSTEFFFF